jgi:hypothetical protein
MICGLSPPCTVCIVRVSSGQERIHARGQSAAAAAAAATAAVAVDFPMCIYEAVVSARTRGGPLPVWHWRRRPRYLHRRHRGSLISPQCMANDATAIPDAGATGHRPKDTVPRSGYWNWTIHSLASIVDQEIIEPVLNAVAICSLASSVPLVTFGSQRC